MVAVLLPNGQQQFFDNDGEPLALGTVDFYVPSTTTRKNTWSDRAQSSLNTNPVVLDADGRATIWGDGNYRQVVKDALGNTIWDKETSGAPDLSSIYGTGYTNTYTAVGGETAIPLTDQNGNSFTVETSAVWTLSFFRNGVRQQPGIDYTTNGTSNVTITTAAIANEVYWWVQTGGASVSITTPSDGSVTPPKLSTITATADNVPYFASATTWGQTPFPAYGRTLVGNASAADARTDLGLVIGTDVQAYSAYLADIAAITPSQGDIIYFNGTDWVRLAAGTNGYFLKTQGAGANPAWDAVAAAGITINTTTITGGTNGRVLYNNTGTVGEKAVTGTGDAVLATSPTLVTPTLGVASASNLTVTANTVPANGFYLPAANKMGFATNTTAAGVIDSSQNLTIGTTTQVPVSTGTNASKIQGVTDSASNRCGSYGMFVNSASGPSFSLFKSRSGTVGTNTVVQADDILGFFDFEGADGTNYVTGAFIAGFCDGTPGANDMPGRIVISTTPDGSTSGVTAIYADRNQEVYFPNVGTTASAANAFLDSGSTPTHQLLRSTSSIRYKKDVETLEDQYADKLLGLRPVWYRSKCDHDNKGWGWYGLIAEEVANIDPRLVHWSHPVKVVEKSIDGEKTFRTHEADKDKPMEPDGVQYERIVVGLLNLVQRMERRVAALESELAGKQVA